MSHEDLRCTWRVVGWLPVYPEQDSSLEVGEEESPICYSTLVPRTDCPRCLRNPHCDPQALASSSSVVVSCAVVSSFDAGSGVVGGGCAPEWPTTELWELGDLLYVATSFRWADDPPAYLDPGPVTRIKSRRRLSVYLRDRFLVPTCQPPHAQSLARGWAARLGPGRPHYLPLFPPRDLCHVETAKERLARRGYLTTDSLPRSCGQVEVGDTRYREKSPSE